VPERLSPYRRSRIVSMRLQGYGRNEVARQTGENPVTVGRELRRFEELAASRGLWQASEEYNVSEQVQRLYRVAQVAREHKLTPEELAEAAPAALVLKEAGVEFSEIHQILTAIVLLQRSGLVGDRLVEACKETLGLIEKFGSYEKARASFEELSSKIPQLKEEFRNLQAQLKEAQDELEEAYREAGVAKDSIARFEQVRERLRGFGLDLKDLELALQALSGMKALGYEPNQIVAQLKRAGNLEEQISAMENKIAALTREKEALLNEIASARQELEPLKALLEEGRKLKELGLGVSHIERIRTAILDVAARHGLDPVQALDKFCTDILNNFDPLLGLEAKAKELEARCAELTQREMNLKASISELKEEKRRLGHAIDVYAKLKARGLKDATLLLVQRLVDEAGLAVPSVIAEIKDLAQLEERKREAVQQLNALRREVEGKQLLLQDLTERRMELERGISQFLEGLVGKLNELGERLASAIAASGENAQREADAAVKAITARVEQLNATITNATENVEKAVGAIGAEIQRLLEKARAASSSAIIAAREAGKLELQADIWRLLAGKDVDRASVFALLSSLVPRLIEWAEGENLYGLREKVLELKEELDDLLRYGTS